MAIGAGELAQQLRVLAEDQDLIPRTRMVVASTVCDPVPGDPTPSFGLQGQQVHAWYTYLHVGNIFIHIKS